MNGLSSTDDVTAIVDSDKLFNTFCIGKHTRDLTPNQTSIPLLPRDARILLLDIEGTTTSISFVKDVLFPYALKELPSYLQSLSSQQQILLLENLESDIKNLDSNHPLKKHPECKASVEKKIVTLVELLMKNDVKATGLKELQGKIWKDGYIKSQQLKGHVYQDFKPFLQWCHSNSIQVNIYSSGSVDAQKLLFGHTIYGNLLNYINKHYDTCVGGKKESSSYINIANDLKVSPEDIVFISDSENELTAARRAGIGFSIMSVRPGNTPLTSTSEAIPKIFSLLQVCGSGI